MWLNYFPPLNIAELPLTQGTANSDSLRRSHTQGMNRLKLGVLARKLIFLALENSDYSRGTTKHFSSSFQWWWPNTQPRASVRIEFSLLLSIGFWQGETQKGGGCLSEKTLTFYLCMSYPPYTTNPTFCLQNQNHSLCTPCGRSLPS